MKKIAGILLVFSLLLPILAVNANKLYVQAITEQNPSKRLQLLEQWLQLFGNEKKYKDRLPFVYLGLYDAARQLKLCDKITLYGPKAIEYAQSDLDKPFIYSKMADCYRKARDCEKASENFEKAIEILRKILANPPKNLRVTKYKVLLASDLRLSGFCYFSKGNVDKGMRNMMEAAKLYEGFGSRGKKMASLLYKFMVKEGQKYFKKGDYATADKLLCTLSSRVDTYDVYILCALSNEKLNAPEEKVIKLYEVAYNKKKNGVIAYKLGKYYLFKSMDEKRTKVVDTRTADLAIKYLAEAAVLLEKDPKQKKLYEATMKMLKPFYERRYLNVKEKPSLEKILADARARVGK